MTFMTPAENANPTATANRKTGRAIFAQAFNALKKDKRVLLVPVVAMAANLFIFAAIAVAWILLIPVMDIYNATNTVDYVLGAVMYLAFAATHVFSQAIIMAAANDIFEGKKADLGAATKEAFSRFGSLFLFALLEGTVGLILRAIADNLKGIAGSLVRFVGGLAWSIGTYFAIPGILFDDLGAFKSIGESGRLIKSKWGNVMRSNVVAGAIIALMIFGGFASIVGGVALFANVNSNSSDFSLPAGSVALWILGVVLVLIAGLLQGAILAFLKVALYRFAKGKSSAEFDSSLLNASFKVKN
jgi:hypothetical protein